MDYTKLTGLRNVARKLGINKLLTYSATKRNKVRLKEYKETKPKFAELELSGHSIKMHVIDSYEWMRVQSFYEDKHIIAEIAANLKSGGSFWDIGASIGLYSNMIAKILGEKGKVISFEPEDRSRGRLNENIKLNGNENISVFPIALGSKKDTLHLQLSERLSSGTHQLTTNKVTDTVNTKAVEVLPADEFMIRENLSVPTVLKIDVEGFEEEVLKGAKNILSNPECKAIIIEVHFSIMAARGDDKAPNRIKAFLSSCGFTNQEWIDFSHLVATK